MDQQNPYLQILNQMKSQGPQSPGQNVPGAARISQMASQLGQQQGPQAGGLAGGGDITKQDVTQPGANPGTTKPLLSALQALHGFITSATDPQEIAVVRSIIIVLNQLIQRDQSSQGQNPLQGQTTGAGQQGPQQAPQQPTNSAPTAQPSALAEAVNAAGRGGIGSPAALTGGSTPIGA